MRVEEATVRVNAPGLRTRLRDVTSVAAVLVAVAALLASLAWISSGKAGGRAGDLKTAALGFMMLRLEAATESSNALVQAQSYLTQAGMYYAEADSTDDAELEAYLTDLGDQSIELSEFQASAARDAETRAQGYFDEYERTLDGAAVSGRIADRRSTAALILNVSATVASMTVLLRKRWLLLLFAPVFLLGIGYLAASLF
jgi:flagellar basal body-associated protein FliL